MAINRNCRWIDHPENLAEVRRLRVEGWPIRRIARRFRVNDRHLASVIRQYLPEVAGLNHRRMGKPFCRHCHVKTASRARGLCWTCDRKPKLRRLYQGEETKFTRRGVGADFNGGYREPTAPTDAPPGSPEKVAVLEERARLGLSLWHHADATHDRESRRLGVA